MRVRGPWLVLLVLLGATTLLFFRSQVGDDEILYYSPEQYGEKVDTLIRRGLLVAECDGADTRIRLDEGASEEDRNWYQGSYLAQDVARFNEQPENFGWYFTVDNNCQLLAIDRTIHTIEMPFARRARWLGWIFYADRGSDAQLRSVARVLSFVKPEAPVAAEDFESTRVGARRSLQSDYLQIHYPRGRSQPAGDAYMVGDRLVFNHRKKEGTPGTAQLMGYRMPEGRAAWLRTGDWLYLAQDGTSETFVYTGGEALEAASLIRLQNERPVRTHRDHGLGWQEGLNPEEPNPFVATVSGGLNNALAVLPFEEAAALSESFDLQLTVRRDLQESLQSALAAYAERISTGGRDRSFPAGITVMDGKSGDVLAVATYPTPEILRREFVTDVRIRRRLLQNQNFLRHPIGSAGKPFYFAAAAEAHPELLELELDTHPPVERHRDLFHCQLPGGYQLLGNHFGPIDFEKALEVSCNKYTIELATLALVLEHGGTAGGTIPRDDRYAWPLPGQRSGVRLGGRELTYAPALEAVVTDLEPLPEERREPRRSRDEEEAPSFAVARCEGLNRLEQSDFAEALPGLTGAEIFLGRAPTGGGMAPEEFYRSYLTQRYDLRPWRAVVERVAGERDADDPLVWRQRGALREVAPERVNLALNTVTQLRQEWVSLLLGGASSIWTNVQLAEASSRLVTGRAVEARLSRVLERSPENDAGDPSSPPETGDGAPAPADPAEPLAPLLELTPPVREAVLRGMERVVEGGQGTAQLLKGPLAALRRGDPDHDYRLYSKTGSPVVVRPVHPRLGPALDALVPEHLILDGRRVRFKTGNGAVWAPRGEERSRFFRELEGTLRQRGFGRFRLASAILRLVDDFQGDRGALSWSSPAAVPEEIPGPLYVVGDELRVNGEDGLFTQRLAKGKGSVYFLTLVRLPRGAAAVPTVEQMAAPETRVITAAFYLDFGPDSAIAVGLAEAVFPQLAALLETSPP